MIAKELTFLGARKRLQVAENKREVASGKIERGDPHTPGNSDGYQNKGLARQDSGGQPGKAIRKVVKTKARHGGQERQKASVRISFGGGRAGKPEEEAGKRGSQVLIAQNELTVK